MLAIITRQQERGILLITGFHQTERQNRSQTDDTSVFYLKAGGTGDLTAADIRFIMIPRNTQSASDRAHVSGRKNIVNIYKLIVKGTIEEKDFGQVQREKVGFSGSHPIG